MPGQDCEVWTSWRRQARQERELDCVGAPGKVIVVEEWAKALRDWDVCYCHPLSYSLLFSEEYREMILSSVYVFASILVILMKHAF